MEPINELLQIRDKSAIITGGAKRIGYGICQTAKGGFMAKGIMRNAAQLFVQ